jgi:hypothetical protein
MKLNETRKVKDFHARTQPLAFVVQLQKLAGHERKEK